MSRSYSIHTALRMIPNALLKVLFEQHNVETSNIPWNELKEHKIQPLHTLLQVLPRSQFDAIEAAFQAVTILAGQEGIQSILEAGNYSGKSMVELLPQEGSHWHKAMWAWLNYKATFRIALWLHDVQTLQWWRKRNDVPKCEPDRTEQAQNQLRREIAKLLWDHQGRGRECTIEVQARNVNYYYFAHPDDFVQNLTSHSDDGQLLPSTFRRTFIIVFNYNSKEGTLELFAKVPPRLKPKLEQIFAQTILHSELGPWIGEPTYDLEKLKDPHFDFPTDPEDAVSFQVRKLRLDLIHSEESITLEPNPSHGPGAVHQMIEKYLNKQSLSMSDVQVGLVKLTAKFEAMDGRDEGSMTFDIVPPHNCGLRNQPPERADLGHKYLKRWGLDTVGTVDPHPSTHGVAAADLPEPRVTAVS